MMISYEKVPELASAPRSDPPRLRDTLRAVRKVIFKQESDEEIVRNKIDVEAPFGTAPAQVVPLPFYDPKKDVPKT